MHFIFKMNRIKDFLNTNLYAILIRRLLLSMLLFSVCRATFFLLNTHIFTDVTVIDYARIAIGGLKFDLVAVLYTNVLYILLWVIPFKFRYKFGYQRFLRYLYLCTNSISLLSNCIDIIYFRFTMRRTTWSVFKEFSNETSGLRLLMAFLWDYWYVMLFFLILVWVLRRNYGKPISQPKKIIAPYYYYPAGIAIMALLLGLFIAGVRGGFRHSTRPITLSNAGDFAKRPIEINIVLNTAFSIMKTIELTDLERINYFHSTQELDNYYNPIHQPISQDAFKPLNVVIFILESNAMEYYGFYNKKALNGQYTGYTPFMDSLITQSLTFKYSSASGHKSIDAMPSILCSIPYMVEPFITTRYATNHLNSIASLLKKEGYYSAFFHGAPNGSMGFMAFANLIGYDTYFGKTEYNNDKDFDNMWGIWDEPFFQFFAQKMSTFRQPFITTIFSVSSHHPFKIPEQYEGKFPKGSLPIHQCIGYTDMALKRFFETAGKTPWFKNTLFVFTADHTNDKFLPEYRNDMKQFAVPIVFYRPGNSLKKYNQNDIIQQIDIMPSILGYLGYSKPYFAFGFDIFHRNSEEYFSINYINGIYQFMKDSMLIQNNGRKTTAIFNFKKDERLRNNLISTIDSTSLKLEQNQIKAFIQQYNNRMLDNQLIPTFSN